VLLVFSSYSYCNEQLQVQYGSTQNAVTPTLQWVMSNVLPQQAGLTVGGVVYRYTTEKEASDDMLVHVQNENARGPGYIFRETDDWSGLPGNTIKKAVPVNDIELSYWGMGSIEVTGEGSVSDASVVYTYQYDPCFDKQSRVDCPGYVDPFAIEQMAIDVVDPLDEDYVQDELDRKATLEDDEQEDKDRKKMESKKRIDQRLEKVLGIVNTTLLAVTSEQKHSELMLLAALPTDYVDQKISGGSYEEKVVLQDGKLPENRNGLRNNLTQQLKHEEMVKLQYNNK
jgi:hypothetical protein